MTIARLSANIDRVTFSRSTQSESISMKKIFAALLYLSCVAAFAAAPTPYDESADAQADLKHALSQAQASNKKVLLIFGANWCKDCIELDKSIQGQNAALIKAKFVVIKVDVGQFDKNLAIAQAYGNPIKKGIPAAAVLRADNSVLYTTKAGELSDARKMGDHGIAEFFEKVIAEHP
jgi:thioredoxin 1